MTTERRRSQLASHLWPSFGFLIGSAKNRPNVTGFFWRQNGLRHHDGETVQLVDIECAIGIQAPAQKKVIPCGPRRKE